MTEETIRVLVACGFFMMLLMLRLEARRFGAAEWDEPSGRRGGTWTRLSWYAMGLALVWAIYAIHPSPHDVLFLLIGHRTEVIALGLALAVLGIAQAAVFAWLRYGYLRLPAPSAYPGAAINSLATAVIDETMFRGVLLGSLMAMGLPDGAAVVLVALGYVLGTRMAAPGRHSYMLLLSLGMGLAFGWATIVTGGLGAALIGHAVTSFAVFVCTGHPGQVPAGDGEPEDVAARSAVPEGWHDARRSPLPGRGAEPKGFAEMMEDSGFVDRSERRAAATRRSDGLIGRLRSGDHAPDRRSTRAR